MRQRAFKAALKDLGMTQLAAATKLGVPGGKARISEWERGKRPIPPYITAHIETLLTLHAAEKWREALERGTPMTSEEFVRSYPRKSVPGVEPA